MIIFLITQVPLKQQTKKTKECKLGKKNPTKNKQTHIKDKHKPIFSLYPVSLHSSSQTSSALSPI